MIRRKTKEKNVNSRDGILVFMNVAKISTNQCMKKCA